MHLLRGRLRARFVFSNATNSQAHGPFTAAVAFIHLAYSLHVRDIILVSIPACHAEDPDSIPGRGVCTSPRSSRMLVRSSHLPRVPHRTNLAETNKKRIVNIHVTTRLHRLLHDTRRATLPNAHSILRILAKHEGHATMFNDPGRTRTCNPRLRGPMPYPLGHGAR